MTSPDKNFEESFHKLLKANPFKNFIYWGWSEEDHALATQYQFSDMLYSDLQARNTTIVRLCNEAGIKSIPFIIPVEEMRIALNYYGLPNEGFVRAKLVENPSNFKLIVKKARQEDTISFKNNPLLERRRIIADILRRRLYEQKKICNIREFTKREIHELTDINVILTFMECDFCGWTPFGSCYSSIKRKLNSAILKARGFYSFLKNRKCFNVGFACGNKNCEEDAQKQLDEDDDFDIDDFEIVFDKKNKSGSFLDLIFSK